MRLVPNPRQRRRQHLPNLKGWGSIILLFGPKRCFIIVVILGSFNNTTENDPTGFSPYFNLRGFRTFIASTFSLVLKLFFYIMIVFFHY